MKTMLEILKLVQKELNSDHEISGLCNVAWRLEHLGVLTSEEVSLFTNYVADNQTRMSKIWQEFDGGLFHYPIGYKYPRKRFINRHIKLLEQQ
jgi:predicted RecB family nuclease